MKMVDRQLKKAAQEEDDRLHCKGGIEEEANLDDRHRHELIFFGSKDRKLFNSHSKGGSFYAKA